MSLHMYLLKPQLCWIKYIKYNSSNKRAASWSVYELNWKICEFFFLSISGEGLIGFVRYELVPV